MELTLAPVCAFIVKVFRAYFQFISRTIDV